MHSFVRILAHSFSQSLTYSLTNSLTYASLHPFVPIHQPNHRLIHLFVSPLIHSVLVKFVSSPTIRDVLSRVALCMLHLLGEDS